MNNDTKLLIEVRGNYGNLSRSEAVKIVAEERGLTVQGVSGRVTRAEQTIPGRVALMQWQQDNALVYDKARGDINDIVQAGTNTFIQHKAKLPTNKPHYAVFLSDTHFPYHDVKALALAYKIISDLPVAYISGLSDGFDFSTFSRWPDGRQAIDRAFDGDLHGVLASYAYHLDTLAQIAPNALILALVGNHDVRLVAGNKGSENYLQLEVMKQLTEHGLTFPSSLDRDNIIKINDSLYWFHGRHARKNRTGGAKANYEYVKGVLQIDRDFTLVFGHVHDFSVYRHIKASAYGAGCLCNLQPHYSRYAQQWQHGITISKIFDNQNLTYNIPFDRIGGELVAFNPFNGNNYEVE